MKRIQVLLTAILFTLSSSAQDDMAAAMKMINDRLEKQPQNPELLFFRGMAYGEMKEYRKAITDYNAALANLKSYKPKSDIEYYTPADSSDILIGRALAYDMMNEVDSSVMDYSYLQSRKPNDFWLSVSVAHIYIKHKDFNNAQVEINRLKALKENERGLVYQAILFYEMENYSEALYAINEALAKYPGSIQGMITLAKILNKLNKTDSACNIITQAASKINLEYFGGQRGYHRDFEKEIDILKADYCR